MCHSLSLPSCAQLGRSPICSILICSVPPQTVSCFSYNLTAIKLVDRDVRVMEAFALEQQRLASSSSSTSVAGPAWMTAGLAPDHASQSLARLRELLDFLLSTRCEDAAQRTRLWTR